MAFSEVVKIVPVVDAPRAAKMEKDLNSRYTKIAKTFGKGLQNVMKGSLLGISVGLLAQLLAPLEKVEEKIRSMLGQGKDIAEIAERTGASAGDVKRLQIAGQSLGLTPEELNEMITKFSNALDSTREELADEKAGRKKTDELAPTTALLRNFAELSDFDAFLKFLPTLRAAGNPVEIEGEFGQKQTLSVGQDRKTFEKLVFGEKQTGGARKLIDASNNLSEILSKQNVPEKKFVGTDRNGNVTESTEPFSNEQLSNFKDVNVVDNLASNLRYMSETQRLLQENETKKQTDDFMRAMASINSRQGSIVENVGGAERAVESRNTQQISEFEKLVAAQQGIDEIKNALFMLQSQGTKLLQLLGEFVGWLKTLPKNWTNIFSSGK
jgi:hypothetical protein